MILPFLIATLVFAIWHYRVNMEGDTLGIAVIGIALTLTLLATASPSTSSSSICTSTRYEPRSHRSTPRAFELLYDFMEDKFTSESLDIDMAILNAARAGKPIPTLAIC